MRPIIAELSFAQDRNPLLLRCRAAAL